MRLLWTLELFLCEYIFWFVLGKYLGLRLLEIGCLSLKFFKPFSKVIVLIYTPICDVKSPNCFSILPTFSIISPLYFFFFSYMEKFYFIFFFFKFFFLIFIFLLIKISTNNVSFNGCIVVLAYAVDFWILIWIQFLNLLIYASCISCYLRTFCLTLLLNSSSVLFSKTLTLYILISTPFWVYFCIRCEV